MTRAEFEEKSFEEVMSQFDEERDEITTYERLKEFAIYKIENDDFLVAIHILEAINRDTKEWYDYDYNMGTLDTPVSITQKEDVEHLVD